VINNNFQELEESIIATIKAISKVTKIDVDFNGQKIDFAAINQNLATNISLPKIFDQNDLQQTRGFADLVALYLKFHNFNIYQKELPNQESQKLFDDFEKCRIIKLGSNDFRGIAINLEPILIKSLEQANDHFFLPFLMFLNQTNCLDILAAQLKPYKKLISKNLLDKIIQLSNSINDQQAFSIKVLELIEFLNNQNQKPKEEVENSKKNQNKKKPDQKSDEENTESKIESKIEEKIANIREKDTRKISKVLEQSTRKSSKATQINDKLLKKTNIKFVAEYKVFSKKFDQIIKASDLVSAKDLSNLRSQLDIKLSKLQKISKRLTAKLKRKLLAKKKISYQFNEEEGLLDRKKITQIIANPFSSNNFLTIQESDYQNTVLCILLDNSGSMGGMPILMSAMASEIITKIFEGFGIKTEILGFTTSDWRGGKSRKLWEQSGKPKNPGRLSDLRHIIYKNADQSFRKSKNNLALMLKNGILKENIDGEALIWAAKRLKGRGEKRKILLIISDGTPVDDSTNSNNDSDILNDHLHQTIQRLEKHSKIDIAAIGILHNVDNFYQNSIMVTNIEELGEVMITKICGIIDNFS
jgi:cobaltochelatase CobT